MKLNQLPEASSEEMKNMREDAVSICKHVIAEPGKLRGDYLDLARVILVINSFPLNVSVFLSNNYDI